MAAKSVSQLRETSVDTTSYCPIEGCVSQNQGPENSLAIYIEPLDFQSLRYWDMLDLPPSHSHHQDPYKPSPSTVAQWGWGVDPRDTSIFWEGNIASSKGHWNVR